MLVSRLTAALIFFPYAKKTTGNAAFTNHSHQRVNVLVFNRMDHYPCITELTRSAGMMPPVSAAPSFELLGFYYGKITNARKVGKREKG